MTGRLKVITESHCSVPMPVSMMIAQLTFRGMSLAQGMTMAKMIRLYDIQKDEVLCLFEAVAALPTSPLPEGHITLGRHTFTSTGEVVGHLIVLGLSKNFNVEEIALFICIVGWILAEELAPQQAIDILSDAIQRALPENIRPDTILFG